jgi:hypothetical protein
MGGSSFYELVGSFGEPSVTSKHTDTHNGNTTLLGRVPKLAEAYLKEKGKKIRINDMSLRWGGLFDIGNNWTSIPGHGLHREGKSVDISRFVNADGIFIEVDQETLNDRAALIGLIRIPEPDRAQCPDCIHYELF